MGDLTYYGAILSLYDNQYKLDKKRMRDYIRFLLNKDIKGFFPCGTSGEYVLHTTEENIEILQLVLEENDNSRPIVPCASTSSFRTTVDLIEKMENMGIRQVSVCPPYYTPLRQEDILDYYTELIRQTNVDIYLYNIPSFTNAIEMATFEKLCTNKRIVGIKDSSGNLKTISRYISYINDMRDDFNVMTGTDEIILPAIVSGCSGSVSVLSAIIPEVHNALYANIKSNLQYARELQNEIVRLAVKCESVVFPVGYKLALMARNFDAGYFAQNIVEQKEKEKFSALEDEIRQNVSSLLKLAGE